MCPSWIGTQPAMCVLRPKSSMGVESARDRSRYDGDSTQNENQLYEYLYRGVVALSTHEIHHQSLNR